MEMKVIEVFRHAVAAGALAALAAGVAAGQEAVERQRPAPEDGVVEIVNANGSVQVLGWKERAVAVAGTLGRGVEGLTFTGDEYRTSVRVEAPEDSREVGPSHLVVRVPEGSRVEVETSGADIEVAGVNGMLFLQSVSGDIRVKDRPREVDAKSVGGEVEILASNTRVKAASTGGRITLKETSGEADVSTVSGNIVVDGGRYERGRFRTVSGDMRFEGGLEENGVFEFTSHSGNIDLLLPGSVAADFLVSNYRGEIENDFQPGRVPRGPVRDVPRQRMSFSTRSGPGGGLALDQRQARPEEFKRARVVVSSFSGTLKLKKK